MAHERKRIRRALDRRWQNRHEPLVVAPVTLVEPTITQVQLSSQNMANEQRRNRAALATWKPSANLAPVTGQILKASPAQHTSGVRKPLLVHDPTGPHIPSIFAAMVCTAVAHGSEWAEARVMVDSDSEHPPLSQSKHGRSTGTCWPYLGRGYTG